jgi:hypothetical protein
MIRRILAFALIAVFAVVLVEGCSDTQEETIEFTTRDYYSAYNAEAWDVCLGHIDDTNNVGASVIQSALEQSRAATGKVTVDRIENIDISGLSATADVTLSWAANAGGETQKWTFVKKDGDWKISYPGG